MLNISRPCIRKCCLNDEDICMGCFRTLDDMRVWHKSSDKEKLQMLKVAGTRKMEMKKSKSQKPKD